MGESELHAAAYMRYACQRQGHYKRCATQPDSANHKRRSTPEPPKAYLHHNLLSNSLGCQYRTLPPLWGGGGGAITAAPTDRINAPASKSRRLDTFVFMAHFLVVRQQRHRRRCPCIELLGCAYHTNSTAQQNDSVVILMLLIRHSFVMEITPVAVLWRCVVRATPGSMTAQTAP